MLDSLGQGLGEFEEEALDFCNGIALGFGAGWVFETRGEAGGQKLETDLLECLRRGGDLRDNVATLAALVKHRLDAADLALDPTQTPLQVPDDVVAELHRPTPRRYHYTPGGTLLRYLGYP